MLSTDASTSLFTSRYKKNHYVISLIKLIFTLLEESYSYCCLFVSVNKS